MKTIIRISPHAADSPDRITAEKLPMMAVRMLSEAFSVRREELGADAMLVVDRGKDEKPVYITIGSKPPELAIGDRRVFGVFSPPESQEPVASFYDRSDAETWMATYTVAHNVESKIGEIDATDKPVVRVAVAAILLHEGKVLLGKLKKTGLYVLPEGSLEVGESIESAVARAVMLTTGLRVGRISVSKHAPYVSTFVEKAGQHFLTLVMSAEYAGGEPTPVDAMWESVGWFDAEDPPAPLFVTVQQIIALAKFNAQPPLPPIPSLPQNPPSLVVAAAKARLKAKKLKAKTKVKTKTKTKRRR